MPSSVLVAATSLRDALAVLEPGSLSGSVAGEVAEELAVTEKACAAVRLLVTARAIETGQHRERGFKDGPSWYAHQSGLTVGQSRHTLSQVKRLTGCPDTKAALAAGEISLAQAREILDAEEVTPGAERELLGTARHSDLSQLRDRAREHRQAHADPEDLHRRQLRARMFRHWQDRDGMIRFSGALPPETGLPLVERVEGEAMRTRRADQAAGRELGPFHAYAADALAALATGGDPEARKPSSTRAELVVVCDLFAWRRGHTHAGEVCHIIGGGPIPVDLAHELSRDAFIKAVLHDGTNIHTIKHFGRHLPAVLRTGLDLGPVPQFTGRACVDCGSKWGLEYDHVNPVANDGPTEYANLQPRCWKDHQIKTEQDREAGLLGSHPTRAGDTP